MDLSLDYACRQCGNLVTRRIVDLVPSRRPTCPRCGGAAELTADALQQLRAALDDLEQP